MYLFNEQLTTKVKNDIASRYGVNFEFNTYFNDNCDTLHLTISEETYIEIGIYINENNEISYSVLDENSNILIHTDNYNELLEKLENIL